MKKSELAKELWPFFRPKVQTEITGGVTASSGSAGGTTTHAIGGSLHTGTLDDSQAPQFLKTDGSRALTGNLSVDAGVTIDGVDLGVHATDVNAHHARDHATRHEAGGADTVNHDNLTGFVANEHINHSGVSINAGNGLTGGGDITASRTLAVGAGDGIDVAANSVAVDVTDILGTGLTESSNNIVLPEPDDITATTTNTRDATGHTHNAVTTADGAANHSTILQSDSAGGLKLDSLTTVLIDSAGSDNLLINPGGDVHFPNAQTISTQTFDSSFPIQGFQINEVAGISGLSALTIGRIQADELHVKIFVADEVRVDRGDEYWAKSYGLVAENFDTPSATGNTVSVTFEDSPAITGAIFSDNDWLLIRKVDRSGGGLDIFNVWGQVATYVDNGDGTQSWTFTLRSGPVNEEIKAGSLAIDFGASGQAIVHLSTIDAAGAPYIKMRRWAGSDPFSPSNFTTYVQLGNLDNISNPDVTPSGDGLYIRSTGTSDNYLVADDNGLKLSGGGGFVKLDDSSGITISATTTNSFSEPNAVSWQDSGTTISSVDGRTASGVNYLYLKTDQVTNKSSEILLQANTPATTGEQARILLEAYRGGSKGGNIILARDTGDNSFVTLAAGSEQFTIHDSNGIDVTTSNLNIVGDFSQNGNLLTISGTSSIDGVFQGNVTGNGTVATQGFTLTVPATGTAALVGRNNSFTTTQDVDGFIRSTKQSPAPTADAGIEVFYHTSQLFGRIQVYDRDASAYEPLSLNASRITFDIEGTEKVRVNDTNGHLLLNTTTDAAQLSVQADGASTVGLVVDSASSSTAAAMEINGWSEMGGDVASGDNPENTILTLRKNFTDGTASYRGFQSFLHQQTTSNANPLIGVDGAVHFEATSGNTASSIRGGSFTVSNQNTGTVSEAKGIETFVWNESTGTITNGYGADLGDSIKTAGTISNMAGCLIREQSDASNNTSLLIQNGATIPSGNFGIYINTTYTGLDYHAIHIETSSGQRVQFFARDNGDDAFALHASKSGGYSKSIIYPLNLGNNTAGPLLSVGRNSNGGTEGPAAGSLEMQQADAGFWYLWVDNADKLRIHSSAPTGSSGTPTVTDTAGAVVGDQTSWYTHKTVLEPVLDTWGALETLLDTNVYKYQYQESGYLDSDGNSQIFTGVVGYNRDDWFLKNCGPGQTPALNEATMFGTTILGIKALHERIQKLEAEVLELRNAA